MSGRDAKASRTTADTDVSGTHRPARLIFALAFLAGIWQVAFPSGYGFGTGWEAVAIARELFRTGSFGNPFEAGPSGPTAVIPPVFPFFLSVLMKLLGDSPAFALVASILAVVAQATSAALLPRVSLRMFSDARPGIYAGFLAALAFRLMPQWDVACTCCGLSLIFLYSGFSTIRQSCLSGLAVGFLLLTNPSCILIAGPWLAYLFFTGPDRTVAGILRCGAAAAVILITVLPWMARNHVTLGTWSIKNNLGSTLFSSTGDCSLATLRDGPSSDCPGSRNPNKNPAELAALRRLGETRYDAVRKADTLAWIEQHPADYARLTKARIVEFWFPQPPRDRIVMLATILSFPGLFLLLWRRPSVGACLLSILLLYPLVYYMVVADLRYRYPSLSVSLLCAGYLLTELTAAISNQAPSNQAPSNQATQTNKAYPEPPSPQTDAHPART